MPESLEEDVVVATECKLEKEWCEAFSKAGAAMAGAGGFRGGLSGAPLLRDSAGQSEVQGKAFGVRSGG